MQPLQALVASSLHDELFIMNTLMIELTDRCCMEGVVGLEALYPSWLADSGICIAKWIVPQHFRYQQVEA